MTFLRVSAIHHPVTALGYGRRLGIWVQGCPLACKGCMSLDTWPVDEGTAVAVDELVDVVAAHADTGDDGVTISGGEPLAQAAAVGELLGGVRDRCAGRDFDILLYTGYELSELDAVQAHVAQSVDVLITGRFEASRPTDLIWRGSANQTMHLCTDLGRRRYSSFIDFAPASAPIQLRTDGNSFRLIGVPRRGTLATIERGLRAAGVNLTSMTWRRSRRVS